MSGEGRKGVRFVLPKLGNSKTAQAAWAAQADPELSQAAGNGSGSGDEGIFIAQPSEPSRGRTGASHGNTNHSTHHSWSKVNHLLPSTCTTGMCVHMFFYSW